MSVANDPSGRPIDGMIGSSPAMSEVYQLTRLVAPTPTTVLLTGETGTGKELVARAVHELSNRASGPFVRSSYHARDLADDSQPEVRALGM